METGKIVYLKERGLSMSLDTSSMRECLKKAYLQGNPTSDF